MQNALTGNPALPGKPSGPCNMHAMHTELHTCKQKHARTDTHNESGRGES